MLRAGRRFAATCIALGMAIFATACAPDPKPKPKDDAITSVDVDGSAFRVTLASGRVLSGPELAGATLTLKLTGDDAATQVRLDRITVDPTDPSLLLHEMSAIDPATSQASPLCEADADGKHLGFPLAGQWDAEGARTSNTGITLACAAGGALGKCVMWGYRPWKSLPDGTSLEAHHAACVRMVRADYCGGGATTEDGMEIDFFDASGIVAPDDAGASKDKLVFEAAWSPEGAVCVAHPRVAKNVTLDQLAKSCPRLAGRLGPACTEANARAGEFGRALLFNRSKR